MKSYIIYKLTRDDGMEYIGTTRNYRFKARMSQHRSTLRFRGRGFDITILENSDDPSILEREHEYISLYDTFHNGLNETWSGRGQHHNSSKFTTVGMKYSDASRQRMRDNHWARKGGTPWCKGKKNCFPPDVVEAIRRGNQGKRISKKLSIEQQDEIIQMYKEKFALEGVGEVQRNGRRMSYLQAFAKKWAPTYGCTHENIKNLVKRHGG